MVYRRCAVLLLLVLILAPSPALGQEGAEAAAAEVRALVRALDPHSAYRVGQEPIRQYPDSAQLRAWWLVAGARAGREAESLEAARTFAESEPEEGWAWFALAGAQLEDRDSYRESPESAKTARKLLGSLPDVEWMLAQTLISAGQYDEALEITDGTWADPVHHAAMLRQRSRALYYTARQVPENRDLSLEVARQAVEVDPTSPAAVYGLGVTLQIYGDREGADEYLTKALELSPGSIPMRQPIWRGLTQRTDISAEEKAELLLADIDALIDYHDGSAAALMAGHNGLRSAGADERRRAIGDQILSSYPESTEAEWIAVSRYREIRARLGGPQPNDPAGAYDLAAVEEYRAALTAFLARSAFHRQTLRGDAYRELFQISEQGETPDAEELLEIVDGMAKYEGINPHVSHAGGAIALAERTSYYDRAEEIAREGFDIAREKIEGQRDFYRTQAEFDESMDWMMSMMHDALGWVFFQSDRIDDAEVELMKAHELDPDALKNLYHLGQLHEYNGDRGQAERFYVLGLNVDTPTVNPNRAALEELYERDHGSLDGFDDYLADIAVVDAEARHEEILDTRIEEPAMAAAFALENISGDEVSLDSLAGKITIVNFWGIWCYWCLLEMDELQQLHEMYADDPDVTLVTINNDPNPDEVPAWMEEHGYSFPVLFDDGFVGQVQIEAFPTTWFLDDDGRIVFEKIGWSQEVVQEFAWRVEAIRKSRRP